ncbi:MAG: S24 family peptidase [Candidatus Paceibacterota bacterium]|jgi:SOS-response transcriptional repressor LexA
MHIIQQKILALAKSLDVAGVSLRKIGELIDEPNAPQKIKHHMDKLKEKGLLVISNDGKIKPAKPGINVTTHLISLPILGSANCGTARSYANGEIEGYLKVSKGILGEQLIKKVSDLFVIRASGNSMNRASIHGKTINDGDYVIAEKTAVPPQNGDYIVSIIEGLANIKRFFTDKKHKQIMLLSESTFKFAPIYIHERDYSEYFVGGKVAEVIKKPEEILDSSAGEVLKYGKPIKKVNFKNKK